MIRTIFVMFLFCATCLHAATNDFGTTDFTNAVQMAKKENRPIVVQFHASWCGPCRLMKQTTLQDRAVKEALTHFNGVSLDFDLNPELADQFGIRAIPAFLILDAEGEQVAKSVGYQDAKAFRDWLMEGLSGSAFAEGQRLVFRQKRLEIEKKLQSSDPAEKQQVVVMLLDYCGSPEKNYQSFASDKLQPLCHQNPAQLLPGLNHPKLATRIFVSNLLRAELGETFAFDPWEGAKDREKVVVQWQAKLAAKE